MQLGITNDLCSSRLSTVTSSAGMLLKNRIVDFFSNDNQ